MKKRIFSVFLAVCLLCSVMTVPASATNVSYSLIDITDFLDWACGVSNHFINFIGSFGNDDICPGSSSLNSRHNFVAQHTQVNGKTGWFYICEYCHKSAGEVYESAYSDYVETLPASQIGDDGALYVKAEHDYYYFGFWYEVDSNTWYCLHSDLDDKPGNDPWFIVDFDCERGIVTAVTSRTYNSSPWRTNYRSECFRGYFRLVAPISGYYTPVAGVACTVHVEDTTSGYDYYSDDFSVAVEGVGTESYISAGNTLTGSVGYYFNRNADVYLCSAVAFFADRYYRVRPFDGLIDVSDTSADNSYNKTTRPSAISGSYGVIDGNGNIQQIEATSIVNEDDHTIYNPVTNTTHGITDWTYNYDNRSYDIVSSDGNITVTYGNDNVTIVEPGGTYNVYYVMESASSPTPTPAPVDTPVPTDTPSPVPTVAPHIHSYTSVATRESSCTLAGIRTYTCSECGESYTEQIPATGHTWEIKQDVKTQYDDTGQLIQQGYTIYRCSVCGEEYKEENISSSSVSPISPGGTVQTNGMFTGIFGLFWDFSTFMFGLFNDL